MCEVVLPKENLDLEYFVINFLHVTNVIKDVLRGNHMLKIDLFCCTGAPISRITFPWIGFAGY